MIIRGMDLPLIISCIIIAIILLIFPLIISRKAADSARKKMNGKKLKNMETKLIKK